MSVWTGWASSFRDATSHTDTRVSRFGFLSMAPFLAPHPGPRLSGASDRPHRTINFFPSGENATWLAGSSPLGHSASMIRPLPTSRSFTPLAPSAVASNFPSGDIATAEMVFSEYARNAGELRTSEMPYTDW